MSPSSHSKSHPVAARSVREMQGSVSGHLGWGESYSPMHPGNLIELTT